nr:lanthionine synthetase C family protein [uncultured Pedobacter sp.]
MDKRKYSIERINQIKNSLIEYSDQEPIGLLNGLCGNMLFLFYLGKAQNDEKLTEIAFEILETIIEKIQTLGSRYTFASGLAGVGWVIEHLSQNNFIDVDTNEILEDLDDVLSVILKSKNLEFKYDYLHGSLGIGLYFLNRKNYDKSESIIEDLIVTLSVNSIANSDGVRWLSDNSNSLSNGKEVNFGLSHGISSILVFLVKAFNAGIKKELSFRLIQDTVKYLLSKEQDSKVHGSYFPSTLSELNPTPNKSRLGWCYGDLGVCMSLGMAFTVLKDQFLEEKLRKYLEFNISRIDLETNIVHDAGLCHGTTGISLVYRRLYKILKFPFLLDAISLWDGETLKMAKFDDGIAGYKKIAVEGYTNDKSLLEGVSGIGLYLLTTTYDCPTDWDEFLLVS